MGARHALWFGVGLGATAFFLLAWIANLLAASLALAGLLFYVFVYTRWLKRRTPQNIVIGGAAGAFPPLVGWAAVTGSLDLTAVVFFLIVFYWTPPHFWALALGGKLLWNVAGLLRGSVVAGRAMALFHYSLLYLALLFGAMLVDRAAHIPLPEPAPGPVALEEPYPGG